ncbi:hypothetical protein LWI28_002283 [Acer negundo]|uniref:Uncharacterized protein n=1 Tax=Acer negundo TaxID=4023 RepID=A0AAD5NL32_ACENE|nr:hypothetical protein LWI28_002283 [Acer negundo]KAK4852825.1 hypothetical protein QYF36_027351 [Acer negundo]
MNNGKKKSDKSEEDEVDQLLQAAQDEMLLKLSVGSHIAHLSSNQLDSNLDRRYQALKSIPPSSTNSSSSSSSKPKSPPVVDDDLKTVLGDDLSSRFAALKSSLAVSSASNNKDTNPKISDHDDADNDSEDEVDKVIRWAMDAARLDPSPPSDDDDDDDDDDVGDVAKQKGHNK